MLNIAIFLTSKLKLHATQENARLIHCKTYVNVYFDKAEEARNLNSTLMPSLRLIFQIRQCGYVCICRWALAQITTTKKEFFGLVTLMSKEVIQRAVFSLDF